MHYAIDVRGGAPVPLTVYLTVHGPIMTQAGQTMAVDWMGNVPSADVSALLGVDEASNFGQFKAALASWHAPTQNFVYADARGHIGVISAGYYPQVAHGNLWLPLPGTGTDDIDGVIPYPAEPQVYDPPGHVVATANQRPVGPAYRTTSVPALTSSTTASAPTRSTPICAATPGRRRRASPRCRAA